MLFEKKTLRSYGGLKVRATLCRPTTLLEVREALARANQENWKVTFRASGHAFDTQSLNDQLVISVDALENFRSIHVDPDPAQPTVRVGAGAKWRDILAATAAHSLVPYAMPTGSEISAGGSLSTHVISRFSPHFGREGRHVASFRFMTVDGTEHNCSRAENADLFRGAIAGLGYLGLILEITYRLHALECRPEEVAVASDFIPLRGIAHLAETLTACVHENGRLAGDAPDRPQGPYALTAVLYMNAERQGVLTRSHYTRALPAQHKPSLEHSPRSFAHLLLQFAAIFSWTRPIGWWFVLNCRFREAQHAIDEIQGYTFFEDGNVIARRIGRCLGLSVPLRQQTYLIPWDAARPDESSRHLSDFLCAADARIDQRGLLPSIIDVAYLSGGGEDDFYLSSSNRFSAFAVSIAFEKPFGSMSREEGVLRDISVMCQLHGGHVHLGKHVFADPSMLPEMYRGLDAMIALKRRYDPNARLANEFLNRVLPKMIRG